MPVSPLVQQLLFIGYGYNVSGHVARDQDSSPVDSGAGTFTAEGKYQAV